MGYEDGGFQRREERPQSVSRDYSSNGNSRNFSGSNYSGGNRPNVYSSGGGGNSGGNRGNWGGGNGFKNRVQDNSPGELYKPYLVASNEDVPQETLDQFKRLAHELESKDFIARNLGASTVDDIVRQETNKGETILPWRNFRELDSKLYYSTPQAHDIAKQFHQAYDKMKDTVKGFLARNVRGVLGKDLKSPIMFLICYSSDGAERAADVSSSTGLISHIINIADAMLIPVFNLSNKDAEQRLKDYLRLQNNVTEDRRQNQQGNTYPSENNQQHSQNSQQYPGSMDDDEFSM